MGDDARQRSGRVAWQIVQDLAGRLGIETED
jgi:predicted AAA+ superfamily ATPase